VDEASIRQRARSARIDLPDTATAIRRLLDGEARGKVVIRI
jgi:hypothetical protein